MTNFFIFLLALAIGGIAGYYMRLHLATQKVGSVENKIENLLEESKQKRREIITQAKEKSLLIIEEAKKEEKHRRKEISHLQQRLEKRESIFDKKILDLENKHQSLQEKANKIDKIKEDIKEIKKNQIEKLEKIAELNKNQARDILLEKVENESKNELVQRIKKLQNHANEEIEKEAKSIIANTILRCATSHIAEFTQTTVEIPNDEMKGRIIGREGRNIKAIEQLTGVEIIIDDTPEIITISGFNPIRRHVAKKALDNLITDGRIHPARIEEAIESAKKDISKDIKKAGEEAAYKTGIAGLDPKLLQILGRLKYRTSYGQNVLLHSVEVAFLSAMLAEALGADPHIAKKGGLLHDIGKALDHEVQGTHTEIGKDLANKFKLSPEITKAIIEHHEDVPSTLEALIVKVADAISASRPGARRDSAEYYLQRLTELEDLAKSFDGVEKSYAIQAGREVRVFVRPEDLNDYDTVKLAKNIATKIEEDLKYPGEIKVNVIREQRITEYAR